jgi:RimJ/RimL family protein N-acetyltransferase
LTDNEFDKKVEDYLQEWKAKRRARGVLHTFPEMLPSERLEYEKLNAENYLALIPLFENDDSPFLDDRYKNEKAAQENLEFVQDMVFDPKCGGCDFLIKLKGTEQYIGVLHLFDYSLETYADVHLRCTLGYAIGSLFRQKQYAKEALKHLMKYANENHGKKLFLVYTSSKNIASNRLIQSLGFYNVNEEYRYDEDDEDNYYHCEM